MHRKFAGRIAIALFAIAVAMMFTCLTAWADDGEASEDQKPAVTVESAAKAEQPAAEKPSEPAKPAAEPAQKPAETEKPAAETAQKPAETEKPAAETAQKPEETENSASETVEKPSETANNDADAAQKPAETEKPAVETAQKTVETEKSAPETAEKPSEPTENPSGQEEQSTVNTALGNMEEQVAEAVMAGEDDQTTQEPKIDITGKRVTNLRYDENTGILSWDVMEGAETYLISLHFKKSDGSKGFSFPDSTQETSFNIFSSDTFNETIVAVGENGTIFYLTVKGRDADRVTSLEAQTNTFTIERYKADATIRTIVYTYNKKNDKYESDSRRQSLDQGGEVLLNGKSITRSTGSSGSTYCNYYGEGYFNKGEKVRVTCVPDSGFTLKKLEIDGVEVDFNDVEATTITMNQNHSIRATFERPISYIDSPDVTITSDNLDEVAQDILKADRTLLKWDTESVVWIKVTTKRIGDLSSKDASALYSEDIVGNSTLDGGQFYLFEMFKKIENSGKVTVAATPVTKTGKAVKYTITVPKSMRSDSKSKTRTFYLVKVVNGKTTVLAKTSDTKIEFEDDEPGLYLLGYKDKNKESSSNGAGTYTNTGIDMPEPTAEPEAQVQAAAPVISAPAEEVPEDTSIPILPVAAGTAAAGGLIFFAFRRMGESAAA